MQDVFNVPLGVAVFKISFNINDILKGIEDVHEYGVNAVKAAIPTFVEELQNNIHNTIYYHVRKRTGELGGAFWVTSDVSRQGFVKITVNADYDEVPYIGSHIQLTRSEPLNLTVYPRFKSALSLPMYGDDDEPSMPFFGEIYNGIIHDPYTGEEKRVLKPFVVQQKRVPLYQVFEKAEAELSNFVHTAYMDGVAKAFANMRR